MLEPCLALNKTRADHSPTLVNLFLALWLYLSLGRSSGPGCRGLRHQSTGGQRHYGCRSAWPGHRVGQLEPPTARLVEQLGRR